jgi:glutamine synthetase
VGGALDRERLERMVHDGDIDTILVVFPDMQGRFMGKRVMGDFFLHEVLGDEGMHACNYLLTVDVDMEPLPGYRYANWDKGYGDFAAVPDMNTLRLVPWLEKTALVICDLLSEEGEIVEVAPRQILKRQLERAKDKGYRVMCGSGARRSRLSFPRASGVAGSTRSTSSMPMRSRWRIAM